MKRIIYIINYLSNGGPSKVLLNIINNINDKKYNITILTIFNCNDSIIINELKKKKINIIQLNIKKNIFGFLVGFNKVKKIINKKYMTVHVHGLFPTIILSACKKNINKIVTIHNNIFEDYKISYGVIIGKFLSYLNIVALKKYDKVICCSQTSSNILKKYIKNIKCIQNGINVPYDKRRRKIIRKKYNIPNDGILYIYCGNISKLKRVIELVELFNEYLEEKEYLFIIGGGEVKENYNNINKNIHFLGYQNNVTDYFAAADVYTSYSSSEGFSISIIEALANNLLLLVSDIDSHKECFNINPSFYIGETFNYANFLEKKNRVISFLLSNKKSNNIRNFQMKYLSGFSMAKEYAKIYDEIRVKEK